MEKLLAGLDGAARRCRQRGAPAAAEAILTTDNGPKQAVSRRGGFTVGGMAKGAGMIHPRLATMLAVVTTDYPLEPGEAVELLRPAVDASFNRISVDGECSTNDAVVLLANGASGVARDAASDARFADALRQVCSDLARQIVEDGEGATVLLEIRVSSASSDEEAVAVARRIATSPLVKTAAFGRDPNWGRVLAAAGSAPWNGGFARLDPELLTVGVRRDDGVRAGRADRPDAVARRRRGGDRPRPRARRGSGRVPRVRPHVRLREAERGVHDVTRVVVKVGGRVAAGSASSPRGTCGGHEVVVVHGAGPQIDAELARQGSVPSSWAGAA